MSQYNNKFILSKVILLLGIKIVLNYFYSYYWNTIPFIYYIILKFIFHYIYCTQLNYLYNIKKFLNKELKCINKAYKKINI